MDYSTLRARLDELRNLGNGLLEQLTELKAEDSAISEAANLMNQFFTYMDTPISQLEAKARKNSETYLALKKFIHILSPNTSASAEFETHKATVSEYLATPAENLDEFAKPYALFAALVEQPDMDLSSEDGELIDAFFGRGLTRPLYQGKYSFADDAEDSRDGDNNEGDNENEGEAETEKIDDGVTATANIAEMPGSKPEASPEPDAPAAVPLSYLVTTQKENSTFSAKAFLEEYSLRAARHAGKIMADPLRRGELELLHLFAQLGALTYRQLEKYAFIKGINNSHLEKLLQSGYVSTVDYEDFNREFFALSANGAKIFKKDTSRDLMRKVQSFPPTIWDSSESCLSCIEDVWAYERAASLALFMMRPLVLRELFPDLAIATRAERISVEKQQPVVLIRVATNKELASSTLSFILQSSGERINVFLFNKSQKQFFVDHLTVLRSEEFLKNAPANHVRLYSCKVADNHMGARFFNTNKKPVSFRDVWADLLGLLGRDASQSGDDDAEPSDPEEDISSRVGRELSIDDPEGPPGSKIVLKVTKITKVDEADIQARIELKRTDGTGAAIDSSAVNVNVKKSGLLGSDVGKTGTPKAKTVKTDAAKAKPAEADNEKNKETEETPSEEVQETDKASEAAPSSLAQEILAGGALPKDREVFETLVSSLLAQAANGDGKTDCLGRALVLLKSLSASDGSYEPDYRRLLLATDLPLDSRHYAGEGLLTLFNGKYEGSAMHLAALLRALFAPDSPHDYALPQYAAGLFERYDEVFGEFPGLKPTLKDFLEISDLSPEGFSERATSHFLDAQTRGELFRQMSKEAEDLKSFPNVRQHLKGLPELLAKCFGAESPLGMCMEVIAGTQGVQPENRTAVCDAFGDFTEDGKISQEKIKLEFDEAWRKIHARKVQEIVGVARDKILEAFRERLDLIERWIGETEDASADEANVQMHSKIQATLRTAHDLLREDLVPDADRAVFARALSNMSEKLEGTKTESFTAEDWLSGGFLPLKDGVPVIDERFVSIEFCEPWRNVLRHIAAEPQELDRVLSRIEDETDPLYDNLGQAVMICGYLNDADRAELYRKSAENARKAAAADAKQFCDGLAMELAYGRVSAETGGKVRGELETLSPLFFESCDFARFRVFLSALCRRLDEEFQKNRALWAEAIQARRGKGGDEFLDQAERFLEDENASLNLVEEALSYFDTSADPSQCEPFHNGEFVEGALFEEFSAEANFNERFDFCRKNKSAPFRKFAPDFVKRKAELLNLPQREVDSAQRLVQNLPNDPKENDGAYGVKTVLEELGFSVKKAARDNPGSSPARFTVQTAPERKNRATCEHPIAEMGTRLPGELTVIELFGNWEPAAIISEVNQLDSRGMPVVLLNSSLSLAQRRQLAGLFLGQSPQPKPFLLIDWVLLLHLAAKAREDRLRALLLCAMPYTGARQLFLNLFSKAGDGALADEIANEMSDEMFIGRTREISQILDKNGPVLVWGGRQLGKTALLLRARNCFHAPEQKDFALYADVKDCRSERSLTEAVAGGLKDAGIPVQKADSLESLCNDLRNWFKPGNKRLLLLLDEADGFLARLANENYAPLAPLEALRRNTDGNFKYVFAGLCNALPGSNLRVGPMAPADAYRLLAVPLQYLGFHADPDLFGRLLVNTNFYPAAVHSFGASIVEILTSHYAEYYNDRKNPPYELTEREISAVMNSEGLAALLEDRIRTTFASSPAHMMLVRCVALLYYFEEEKRSSGYSAETILKYADDLGVGTLRDMGKEKCASLLSDLCFMRVLIEVSGLYRFRQSRFLNIVGRSADEVMEQLSAEQLSSEQLSGARGNENGR